MKPIGKKHVQVVNPRNGRKYSVEFLVVKGKGKPLLGLRASEQMQLISVVQQNIMAIQSEQPSQSKIPLTTESILKEYADVFRGEGKLEGDLHLEIDPNVPPVQLPTRKVPIAIKEKLKEETDHLDGLNIITPVNVPTSWISAIVITLKKYGNVRLCVDPKPLDQALKHNHYPLPTIKDVLPELSAAGLQPDPKKVKAIREMPAPTEKQSIQRLLGMNNYLQKFAETFRDHDSSKMTSSNGMSRFMVQPWKRQRRSYLRLQS